MTRKTKRPLAWILAVSAFCLIFAGCGKQEPEQTAPPTATTSPWREAPEETLGLPVENDYMTFYYPREWEDQVIFTAEDQGETTVVTFTATEFDPAVTLFSVVMTPEESEGFCLGSLSGKDPVHVYIHMAEIDRSDWSEEDFTQISALQERVNDIIYQFYQYEGFTPSNG